MMEGQSLLDDDERTPTHERENVFDDEHEVDDDFDFDGISDGFRPNVDREGAPARPEDDTPAPVVRSVSAHYANSPVPPLQSRNSMRKSVTFANPFASPDDGADAEEGPNMEFEPDQNGVRRSASSTSSIMYAQTGSPRFGAGPSHPYGMYQQGTLARTASVATTSTTRPGIRQSLSQHAPQHPYAMYPQGLGEDDLEDDEDEAMHHNPLPVGFPGIGQQNYTRRMGPDGEDQDIIGEDGHTEQLPPYSRYPEEGPEKMPLLPVALHSRAPVHGTDPGMALMHTPLLPTPTPARPQSMSDDSTLVERRGSGSSRALLSNNGSDSSSSFNEKKTWKEMSWKERRQKKVFGVPLWWLWVAFGVLLVIGTLLGGILGGYVAGSDSSDNDDDTTVLTSLWDARPVPSPTSAWVPTGTFALQLGAPAEVLSDCLTVESQKTAWECNLSPNSELALVVGQVPGGATGASVQYGSNNMSINYGSQLSMMNTSIASFLTVLDEDDPNNGLAFYFQQFYDKVVVLPNSAIQAPSKAKRNGKRQSAPWNPDFHLPNSWHQKKQLAVPGDQPWFCVWNQTFLEGFIYVTQRESTSNSSSAATTTTASPDSSSISSATATAATVGITPTPTGYFTTTTIIPYATATKTFVATLTSGQAPPWSSAGWSDKQYHEYLAHNQGDDDQQNNKKRAPFPAVASVAGGPIDPYSTLEPFPFIVKLEERRTSMPNSISPYCQLYQILDDGTANFVLGSDDEPIIVELSEQDVSFSAYTSAEAQQSGSHNKKRGGAIPGNCHCQWTSGE